jgi:hypothetical protein
MPERRDCERYRISIPQGAAMAHTLKETGRQLAGASYQTTSAEGKNVVSSDLTPCFRRFRGAGGRGMMLFSVGINRQEVRQERDGCTQSRTAGC